MSTFGDKFQALLATGRVANLPTVWSNVLVGFWLCFSFGVIDRTIFRYCPDLELYLLAFTLFTASCLYIGGCMLGDYKDTQFDSVHRPNRPIPSGIISGRTVALCAWLLLISAAFVTTLSPHLSLIISNDVPPSSVSMVPLTTLLQLIQPLHLLSFSLLTTLILTYALFHKKNKPLALTNMGLCRACLYLFAMTVPILDLSALSNNSPGLQFGWLRPAFAIPALCVGLYTFFLSSVASTESDPKPFNARTRLLIGMAALPFITLASLWDLATFPYTGLITLASIALYLSWLIYSFAILPDSKPAFVSNALAGFCLLDACIASTFSLPITLFCLALFGFALLLQKITPAT